MSENRYYVRDRGKVRGPFDLIQLRALRDRGQFSSFHDISEDRQTWTTASVLGELFMPPDRAESAYPLARSHSDPAARPMPPQPADGWYYLDDGGQQRGPFSRGQLQMLRQEGVLPKSTLVWREGMANWEPLGAPNSGLAPSTNDEFAFVTAARQGDGGMGRGIDKLLWYDANKKTVMVAYLLWWFLGHFGAHRFYLGAIGSATVMLLANLIATTLFIFAYVHTATAGFWDRRERLETASIVLLIASAIFLVIVVWWIIDAFLIPETVRNHNNQLIRNLG